MGAAPLGEEEEQEVKRKITRPRPGHADLNGALKYGHRDMRNVLERSSARETTARVAAGAVARIILSQLGIKVAGHVLEIGGVRAENTNYGTIEELQEKTESSPVRCLDEAAAEKMMRAIDEAKEQGDSIGGIVEVVVEGMPAGVGSYVHYDRKLDGKLAGAIMSINAFKGWKSASDSKPPTNPEARCMMKYCGIRKKDTHGDPIMRVVWKAECRRECRLWLGAS